uniref:Uncharacterized protein n=1 Tax=Kuenenia stuttgartiensis TaxID=174633 RepID=Q1PWH3_KUEST|nr:unknown protein [Candidatus Kuenenia stuttgartiensis]
MIIRTLFRFTHYKYPFNDLRKRILLLQFYELTFIMPDENLS